MIVYKLSNEFYVDIMFLTLDDAINYVANLMSKKHCRRDVARICDILRTRRSIKSRKFGAHLSIDEKEVLQFEKSFSPISPVFTIDEHGEYILKNLFRILPIDDILSLASLNKEYNRFFQNKEVWQYLLYRDHQLKFSNNCREIYRILYYAHYELDASQYYDFLAIFQNDILKEIDKFPVTCRMSNK